VTKAMVYVALVKWLHRTVRPGVDVSARQSQIMY